MSDWIHNRGNGRWTATISRTSFWLFRYYIEAEKGYMGLSNGKFARTEANACRKAERWIRRLNRNDDESAQFGQVTVS